MGTLAAEGFARWHYRDKDNNNSYCRHNGKRNVPVKTPGNHTDIIGMLGWEKVNVCCVHQKVWALLRKRDAHAERERETRIEQKVAISELWMRKLKLCGYFAKTKATWTVSIAPGNIIIWVILEKWCEMGYYAWESGSYAWGSEKMGALRPRKWAPLVGRGVRTGACFLMLNQYRALVLCCWYFITKCCQM